MKSILLFTLSLFLVSCEENLKIAAEPAGKPIGTWFFVGKFSHLADYKCFVCDDFDKEKAYKITLNEDGTLNGSVGFLILEGKYEVTTGENQSLKFLEVQRMNKPLEGPEQSEFIQDLEKTGNYAISNEEKFEKALSVNIGNEDFLYFVR